MKDKHTYPNVKQVKLQHKEKCESILSTIEIALFVDNHFINSIFFCIFFFNFIFNTLYFVNGSFSFVSW